MPEAIATPESPAIQCLNCGHALGEPRPPFCPACGQETSVRPPRLGEFLQQFAGAYISTEGALWRTLKLLFLKPGELTRQYLAGRRKHYVLPLRLYLTISLVVLLSFRLAGNLSVDIHGGNVSVDLQTRELPSDNLTVDLGAGRAGLKNKVFFCEGLPPWLCRQLESRLQVDANGVMRATERFADRFVGNFGAAMFVLLPSFALWLKLIYWNRRLRYTEHLVFSLHLHAFWFVCLCLMVYGAKSIDSLAALAALVYAALAARRVYGGRWWTTLLRGVAISIVHAVVLVLVLSLAALWTLLV
jgi:Protein of unknown function (DUF3667)